MLGIVFLSSVGETLGSGPIRWLLKMQAAAPSAPENE